jgi:cation:H+ antiporter
LGSWGEALPLGSNLVIFAIATGLIWIAGGRMVIYGDALASRFGLTREVLGLVFLATVTSLPEIVTTITAASTGDATLVLGNLFGGVTMQTAVLAFTDVFFVRLALTSWPRKPTYALEAALIVVLLNVLLAISFLGEVELFLGIGLGALILTLVYPAAIMLLRSYDERSPWLPVDIPESAGMVEGAIKSVEIDGDTTKQLLIKASIAVFVVVVAGYLTADRAGEIARQTGLQSSFIGIALLAASTSMPEVSTTIAAARMGAYTMAIANIFGSNLIMIALVLPADVFYRGGPILGQIDKVVQFGIVSGVLVTSIYIVGLLIRRTPRWFGAGLDSWLVLAVYALALLGTYFLAVG